MLMLKKTLLLVVNLVSCISCDVPLCFLKVDTLSLLSLTTLLIGFSVGVSGPKLVSMFVYIY